MRKLRRDGVCDYFLQIDREVFAGQRSRYRVSRAREYLGIQDINKNK